MPDLLVGARAVSRRSPLASSSSRVLLLAWPLIALLAAALPAGLLLAGCTDEAPHLAQLVPDAGAPQCTRGTRACACTDTGGCVPGLLCNSGRCFDTEGTGGELDPNGPPAIPGVPPPSSASPPDASTDSGPSSNG